MPVKILNQDASGLDTSSVSLSDIADGARGSNRRLADIVQVYMTEADERVRPEHAALHGTVWDADDPNAPVPPLGENCRCWLEFRAKDEEAARRTGLESQTGDEPEPGDEALDKFWSEAKQSEKSTSPGEEVTPVDTFGKTAGKAIEEGKIKPDEAIDPETGVARSATEVQNVASAKDRNITKRQVLSAMTSLQSMAIWPATQKKIVSMAREVLADKPTLKDEQALFDVIMRLKPGRVASINPLQTRRNARRVAKQIRRAFGPLKE